MMLFKCLVLDRPSLQLVTRFAVERIMSIMMSKSLKNVEVEVV